MPTCLTIAGSDSSGGAGIQADLKTMLANRVYAMSVIAALTAQNTTGVDAIYDVDASFVASQMDSVFTDIYPMAVKIGMVSQKEVILSISGKLKQYHARNIVVDPVMVATSGAKLISDEAIDTLKENLFPLATVLTPNIPEAEVLSELKINNEEEMLTAAKYIEIIIIVQYYLKADIKSMMPMIYFIKKVIINGLKENVLITIILMVRDVLYQVRLLLI